MSRQSQKQHYKKYRNVKAPNSLNAFQLVGKMSVRDLSF